MGEHVDVLVDRARDQEAAVLAVVGGQVRAAAAERDAQRGAAEDHAHEAAPSHRVAARARRTRSRSNHSSVRRTASRIVSCGRQPRPRMRVDVQLDQRAVAGPAAPSAGVFDLGLSARCSVMMRHRVVDDDRLVRCRGCRRGRRAPPRGARRRVKIAATQSLHVQVGLLLAAVAEHAQAGGVALAARSRSRTRARGCSARRGSRRSGRSAR